MKSSPSFRSSVSLLNRLLLIPLVCVMGTLVSTRGQDSAAGTSAVRDALTVQKARNAAVAERGKKAWYHHSWDLSGLPHYQPTEKVSGKLRIWGNNYIADGKLADYWKEGFHRYQPDVEIEYYLPSSAVGLAAVTTGAADIGMTRKSTFLELLAFQRLHKHDPFEIPGVNGSFNVAGWSPAFAIFVNKANPIEHLSMDQLDGIFGGARLGGWIGTQWHPEFARGADKNIRTWGQLGLTGEWANKTINVYGVSMRYNSTDLFSNMILHSSDQYVENMKCYANYQKPDGTLIAWFDQMSEALDNDPYGLNYSFANATSPKTKVVAIGEKAEGPFVVASLETVRDHTYPLTSYQYWYVNAEPNKPMDPKVREFLRYALSQEGQHEVERDGKYTPLLAEVVQHYWSQIR